MAQPAASGAARELLETTGLPVDSVAARSGLGTGPTDRGSTSGGPWGHAACRRTFRAHPDV